ncbi:MFS transporter [Ferroacidibacillus organovorans]|uniref:MFS transporter n=1 Tax=Ferroacidibacillus organovorans TaxID=1765683 RepID=UPI0007A88BB4|nr:MFS transporter [Ferroacidibacillus organovorans]KYP81812.1 MFS transporter [Ferroacidibacillus organovorans]
MTGKLNIEQANPSAVSDLFVVIIAGIGLLLSTLDTGIINVALPTLVHVFHSSLTAMSWTITLYTLALTGTIVLFGRFSDRYGHLTVYVLGLILFALSSMLCGISQSVPELIAFRILQGIGAAMLQATSAALITTIIPESRRGPALGTLGVLLGLGPVLGPSVGGTILSMVSWRFIFFINLPIVAVALFGCRRLKRIVQEKRQHIHLNLAGNVLLSLSILSLLLCLSAIGDANLVATLLFLLFALLIGGFTLRELRISSPILNLKLFRNSQFALAMLAVFFFGGATSIGFIVPPYFLETVRHLSAWQSGLVNLSAPLGLMGFSRLSGKRLGKVGAKRLMGIGLTVMVVAYGVLSQMGVAWSPLLIASLLFVYGAGAGIFVPANLSAIMGAVGRETQGTIGAVQRMVQNLGIAIDTAIAAVLIRIHSGVGSEGLMVGFRAAWGFAAGTLGITLVLFAWLAIRSRLRLRE